MFSSLGATVVSFQTLLFSQKLKIICVARETSRNEQNISLFVHCQRFFFSKGRNDDNDLEKSRKGELFPS